MPKIVVIFFCVVTVGKRESEWGNMSKMSECEIKKRVNRAINDILYAQILKANPQL